MAKYARASVRAAEPAAGAGAYARPRPMDVEHVLSPAPVRPAIPSAPVRPMIPSHEAYEARAAHQAAAQEPRPRAEESEVVRRPSLVDAVVSAFHKFVQRISPKKEEERERDADAVAMGTAAAQVLAVLVSLGK